MTNNLQAIEILNAKRAELPEPGWNTTWLDAYWNRGREILEHAAAYLAQEVK